MKKRKGDRPLTGILMLMSAAGIGLLALLVLAPDYAQAGLNGAKPVSVQSARQADYSVDPLERQRIQPIEMRAVAQLLADQSGSTESPVDQVITLSNRLKTPIATVTPAVPAGLSTRVSSSTPAAKATFSVSALLPSSTAAVTDTPTPGRAAPTLTVRPTLNQTPTRTLALTLAARASATATARVNLPSATARPGFTSTPISATITANVATRTSIPATATRILPTLPAYPPPRATVTTMVSTPTKAINTPTVKPYP